VIERADRSWLIFIGCLIAVLTIAVLLLVPAAYA
jgi:hypothetical protein